MATSNFIDTATIWLHAGKGGDRRLFLSIS